MASFFPIMAAVPQQQPFFRPGDVIPASGIYRVFHGDHRLKHEVTLLRDETFPACKTCGQHTAFELIRAASVIDARNDFRVRLYEIPHPWLDEAA